MNPSVLVSPTEFIAITDGSNPSVKLDNVVVNIFNTIMDVKGNTNDNIKARMVIALFCHCKNMELVYVGLPVSKPKTSFALDNNAQLLIYQWLKSLYFPDGYASNISRLVHLED